MLLLTMSPGPTKAPDTECSVSNYLKDEIMGNSPKGSVMVPVVSKKRPSEVGEASQEGRVV